MDSVGELDRLARSFARHLKAENKSPKTVVTYGEAVGQMMSYLASAGATGVSQVSTEHVEGFMVTLLERRSPATANNRFRALRQFFKWLVQEEYIPSDPKADSVGLSLELDNLDEQQNREQTPPFPYGTHPGIGQEPRHRDSRRLVGDIDGIRVDANLLSLLSAISQMRPIYGRCAMAQQRTSDGYTLGGGVSLRLAAGA